MKKCLPCYALPGIILSVLLITAISGCYYDKAELLYPAFGNCDTAIVKYSTTVTRIMNTSCNSCHGGSFSAGQAKLDTYEGVKVQAMNGKLYGTISHSPGYDAMPLYAPMLGVCDILAIKKWIDEGAPNN